MKKIISANINRYKETLSMSFLLRVQYFTRNKHIINVIVYYNNHIILTSHTKSKFVYCSIHFTHKSKFVYYSIQILMILNF